MKLSKALALIGVGLLVGKVVKARVTASASPEPTPDDFKDTEPSAYPLDAAETQAARPPIH